MHELLVVGSLICASEPQLNGGGAVMWLHYSTCTHYIQASRILFSFIAFFVYFEYKELVALTVSMTASKMLLEKTMITPDLTRTFLPDEKDKAAAVDSSRQLAAFLSTKVETQRIELVDEAGQREVVEIPTSALRLLGEILSELALGNAVKVVPIHAELTTQEGADLLNVSRPHLVKLLDEGALPHTKTGRHRRVKFADLMQFKAKRDQASLDAMSELALQAQELGLGLGYE